MGARLSDKAFLAEMVGLFGFRRSMVLLGWATAAGMMELVTVEDLLAKGPGGKTTRYKHVGDLRRLAAHLRSKGMADDVESFRFEDEPEVRQWVFVVG